MVEASDVTVQFNLRPKDVYDPVRDLFLNTWSNILRWVFVLFVGYLIYETHPIWPSADAEPQMLPALLVVSLLFILVFLALFLFPYLRVRSIFHESPSLRKTRTVSFSEQGIHIESEDGRGDYKWSIFRNIVETPRVFLFMQTTRGTGALYLPKRCMFGSDDVAKLRRLIRANFAGKTRLQPD
jgi:hypothetical protein